MIASDAGQRDLPAVSGHDGGPGVVLRPRADTRPQGTTVAHAPAARADHRSGGRVDAAWSRGTTVTGAELRTTGAAAAGRASSRRPRGTRTTRPTRPAQHRRRRHHQRVATAPGRQATGSERGDRDQREHRDPQQVGAREITDVREALAPRGSRSVLGQRRVGQQRGVVARPEHLEAHGDHRRRSDPRHGPASATTVDEESRPEERRREQRHLGAHQPRQPEQRTRRPDPPGAHRRTLGRESNATSAHQPTRSHNRTSPTSRPDVA